MLQLESSKLLSCVQVTKTYIKAWNKQKNRDGSKCFTDGSHHGFWAVVWQSLKHVFQPGLALYGGELQKDRPHVKEAACVHHTGMFSQAQDQGGSPTCSRTLHLHTARLFV